MNAEPHLPAPANELSNWEVVRRLLLFSWQFRRQCLLALALQIFLLALGLGSLALTGLGVDTIRYHLQPASGAPHWPFFAHPEGMKPMTVITCIALVILVMALIRNYLNYAYTIAMTHLVQAEIVVNMRAAVYEKMQQLSFRFFDANASSTLINRVTGDVQMFRLFVDGVVLQGIIMALSLAIYIVYMARIAPGLTLACLLTTPVMGWIVISFSRKMRPDLRRNRHLNDLMIARLSETVQGIQVIKGFAQEKQSQDHFFQSNDLVRDQQRRIFWRISVFTPMIGFLTEVNMLIVLGYGGYLVLQNQLPLGAGLMVFAGLVQQFSAQINNISNISNSVQQSLISARRVFEILDAPVEIATRDHATALDTVKGEVKFESVSFFYKEDIPTLNDITFTIQPGQCVALLGPLGSGKSTIMSLIPRFYDPTAGRILIDGKDLRDIPVADLRRHIGIVFQENFLFSTTVAENIAFGHPGATQEQIERAAKVAAAHEFIQQLPQGYHTVLGEYGVNLSGGQRQRLAIARAILLDPAILLLDDPTAAVDAETEHEIIEAMLSAIKGRTTFIATHRLSTIVHANVILVLQQGRILEKGTHRDLRAKAGYYKFIADLQLSDHPAADSGKDAA